MPLSTLDKVSSSEVREISSTPVGVPFSGAALSTELLPTSTLSASSCSSSCRSLLTCGCIGSPSFRRLSIYTASSSASSSRVPSTMRVLVGVGMTEGRKAIKR